MIFFPERRQRDLSVCTFAAFAAFGACRRADARALPTIGSPSSCSFIRLTT